MGVARGSWLRFDGTLPARCHGDRLSSMQGTVKIFWPPFAAHLPSPALATVFTPDGTRLASGGYDRTVRLWNVGRIRPRAPWGPAS